MHGPRSCLDNPKAARHLVKFTPSDASKVLFCFVERNGNGLLPRRGQVYRVGTLILAATFVIHASDDRHAHAQQAPAAGTDRTPRAPEPGDRDFLRRHPDHALHAFPTTGRSRARRQVTTTRDHMEPRPRCSRSPGTPCADCAPWTCQMCN